MANRPGDGIRVITPSRKILNRGFHVCLCYDTGGRAEGRPALGNRAKSSKSGSPGPVLTKADAVTDRARRVHRRQTDACSGRPRCCPSSLSQRRRKRSGQKAQVWMKTQLLACVLNLSELVYNLGSEKMKTLTNSERPQEGQGAH